MRKRLLPPLLAIFMLLSMMSATVFASRDGFVDTKGHWAESSVDRWAGYGILNGVDNVHFNPDVPLTRAEMAKILSELLALQDTIPNPFDDVSSKAWYQEAVLKCAAAGIMKGTSDTTASPEATLTREQACVMLARALNIPEISTENKFADSGDISDWAAAAVHSMTDRGILNGVGENRFDPKANITRASVAAILDRSITAYANQSGQSVTAIDSGITLIAAPDVTVTGSAKDVFLAPSAKGIVTLDGMKISGNVTMQASGGTLALNGKTSASNITVSTRADNVVISVAKETSTGTVHINADHASITGDGKVSTIKVSAGNSVTVSVSNAALTGSAKDVFLTRDAKGTVTLDGMEISGGVTMEAPGGTLALKGKTNTPSVTLSATARDAVISIAKDAAIHTLNAIADNVRVTGDGKVSTIKVSSGNSVTVAVSGAVLTGAAKDISILQGANGGVTLDGMEISGNVTMEVPDSTLTLKGKTHVSKVTIPTTAKDTVISIAKDAVIDTLNTAADNVNVVGDGKILVMNVSDGKGVKIEASVHVEKIHNTSPNSVLYGKKIIPGVKSGGGGNGGGGGGSGGGIGGGIGGGSAPGDVSRQLWISELVNKAELVMVDDSSESSFFDVIQHDTYSKAIETALRNHVIERNDGWFYPASDATETFAVETAVRALGFSYDNLSECFQIAKDVGLFTREPVSSSLTLAQKNEILSKVVDIVQSVEIDQNPVNEIIFPKTTKQISYTDLSVYTINPDTECGVLTFPDDRKYAEGECLILPASEEYPYGLAQKITSISKNPDGTVTVTTEKPTLDEVMGDGGKINIAGTVSAAQGTFIPSKELLEQMDVEVEGVTYSRNASARAMPKFTVSWSDSSLVITGSTADDTGFYGSMSIGVPTVKYKANIEWEAFVPTEINDLYLCLNKTTVFEGGFSGSIGGGLGGKFGHGFPLGHVDVPIAGSVLGKAICARVELYWYVGVEGKIGVTWTVSNTVGIQYISGHWRNLSQFSQNTDVKPWEISFKTGPEVGLKLVLLNFNIIDFYCQFGLAGNASTTVRDWQNTCVDSMLYFYCDFSYCTKECAIYPIVKMVTKVDVTVEICNQDHTIWKLNGAHFEWTPEKTGFVPKCTFKEGSLKGSVISSVTDKPILNFEVKAFKTGGDGTSTAVNAITHKDGSFEFQALMRGTYTIKISAENYEPYEVKNVQVIADQQKDLGCVYLEPLTGYITGSVKDAVTNQGICGATVSLNGVYVTDIDVETDEDGDFEFTELPEGRYLITVVAEGYESAQKNGVVVLPEQGTEMEIFFLTAKTSTVTGTVCDSETGDAVSDVTVRLHSEEIGGVNIGTDRSGGFQFDDVRPGTYTITISGKGYATYEKADITVSPDEVTNLGTIKLTPASQIGSIYGYVYDSSTSAGISGANVSLYKGKGTGNSTGLRVQTDASGRYQFTDIEYGDYTITVTKNSYADGFRSISLTAEEATDQNVTLISISSGGGGSSFEFYSQLSPAGKVAYNAMISSANRSKLKNGEAITVWTSGSFTFRPADVDWLDDIDVWWESYMKSDTVTDYMYAVSEAYQILYLDHPEIFWAGCIAYFRGVDVKENGQWYPLDRSTINDMYTYKPGKTYRRTVCVEFDLLDPWSKGRSISSDESTISRQVSSVVSQIDKSGSRYQQLLQAHDWLTKNNVYNSKAANDSSFIPWSPLSALSTSYSPVCQGYATAFKMICDSLNIPCVTVSGETADGEGHMWNYVQMEDGKWYAVDVTWDDPTTGTSQNESGFEHHGYFLVGSDTVIGGSSFSYQHQPDSLEKPQGGTFTYPSLNSSAYGTLSIRSATGGMVTASPERGGPGATITLNVVPEYGYKLQSVTVKDGNGNNISLLWEDDTTCKFVMPSKEVTVTPTFVQIVEEEPNTNLSVNVGVSYDRAA